MVANPAQARDASPGSCVTEVQRGPGHDSVHTVGNEYPQCHLFGGFMLMFNYRHNGYGMRCLTDAIGLAFYGTERYNHAVAAHQPHGIIRQIHVVALPCYSQTSPPTAWPFMQPETCATHAGTAILCQPHCYQLRSSALSEVDIKHAALLANHSANFRRSIVLGSLGSAANGIEEPFAASWRERRDMPLHQYELPGCSVWSLDCSFNLRAQGWRGRNREQDGKLKSKCGRHALCHMAMMMQGAMALEALVDWFRCIVF